MPRAIAGRRPEELTASADELARLGANLLAAETATDAAAALAAAGRQRDAVAWRRRAAMLLGECEGVRTPRVAQAEGPVPLTVREREIALLAASGLSSRVISERLYLSVRTVDNNLARVYGKLGIADRNDIAPRPRPDLRPDQSLLPRVSGCRGRRGRCSRDAGGSIRR